VTGSSAARMIIIFGWAISLLVLSAAQPAARACPIHIEEPDANPASDCVISAIKNNRDVHDHDEPTQPATANKINPLFSIGTVEFYSGSGKVLPQYAALIAGFGPNDSTHSGHVLLQQGTNDEAYTSVHDIAVALYSAISDINSDVAADLLTSYRAISRVRGGIIAAIEVPLNAIGVSNLTQVDVTSAALADDDHFDDSIHKSDLDRLITLIQSLFSLDVLPYYISVLGVYIIFAALRAAIRATHALRRRRIAISARSAAGSRRTSMS
jgi:hypothetical protein